MYEIKMGPGFKASTPKEAGSMISELLGYGQSAMLQFPLSRELQTDLYYEESTVATVQLTSGEKRALLKRGEDISVSTSDSELHPYIILSATDDKLILSKGVCWVQPGNPAMVIVSFSRRGEKKLAPEMITMLIEKTQAVAENEI